MLTPQEVLLLAVIAGALTLILTNLLRADLVALLVMVGLPLLGVVTFEEAFAGFSRPVVLTIIGLFVITEALEDTGVVQWVGTRLYHLGRSSEARLVTLFMGAGALLSLIMNNIAAGAVLLPAAVQVARDSGVPPSKILIPLSFGTLVGGMATYFTTANIILSSILVNQGQAPLGMLDFLPVGGLITLAALAFMAAIGRHMLPARQSAPQAERADLLSERLRATYRLDERLWEVRVRLGAPLAGQSLATARIEEELGVSVLAIWRDDRAIPYPGAEEIIEAEDTLLILGREERAARLVSRGAVVTSRQADQAAEAERPFDLDLTEAVVPPRSTVIGKTLQEISFRQQYGLHAIALWRQGESHRTDVGSTPLEVGDALLVTGGPAGVATLGQRRDFLVLNSGHELEPLLRHKAWWAVGITAAVLALAILEVVPIAEAMLLGMAAAALTGCISLDEAYRAIEWRVVFLITGMLPLSIAMVNIGLAARLGGYIVEAAAPFGPLALIGALFLLTMLLTQVIGGQVVGLIVGPIAVTAALQTGLDPRAAAVAVAIACSAAFLTPIAHPVNILMMGPGGYEARDFLKIGAAMTVLVFVVLLLGMWIIWGVAPLP